MSNVSLMRAVFEYGSKVVEEKGQSIREMIKDADAKGSTGAQQSSTAASRGGSVQGAKSGADAPDATKAMNIQFEVGQYTNMLSFFTNTMKNARDAIAGIARNV